MSNVWTLLIADDCQEDREVYREYLSGDPDQSYQFIEASSAEDGLALCQQQHCDAILLDFCLPDMTGLEFLDELNQQLDLSLPVIMLTGQGDERVAVQAMKRGVQDYLIKQDLEPNVLQRTVRNVIHQSRLQTQFNRQQGRRHLTAEVALHLHRSLNSEEILQTAMVEAQQILECDRVTIYQVMPDREQKSGEQKSNRAAPSFSKRCETGFSSSTSPTPDPVQKFAALLNDSYFPGWQSGQIATEPEIRAARLLVSGRQAETYLLAPIQLPNAPIWGLMVAYQDATQRQWRTDEASFLRDLACQLAVALQQAEQLTQALASLEAEKQLNALKSQLVTTISHEYRTPLAAILAAASTLKLHGNHLPEIKQQQLLQMIESKARRMARLVDDLLVLETFELGQVNFVPQPFELLQFISDLVEEQRQAAGEHHELTFRITGNTKGFLGNQRLLRLILVNLLSNAIQYSPDGGAIDVHLLGKESQIFIQVKDQGIGIPTEDQPQVFQAFSRGSNVEAIPGAGLGLAIVKACIDLHGGEIILKSQEGRGTQFTVCLPKHLFIG